MKGQSLAFNGSRLAAGLHVSQHRNRTALVDNADLGRTPIAAQNQLKCHLEKLRASNAYLQHVPVERKKTALRRWI
jgi:hypothetical protein